MTTKMVSSISNIDYGDRTSGLNIYNFQDRRVRRDLNQLFKYIKQSTNGKTYYKILQESMNLRRN